MPTAMLAGRRRAHGWLARFRFLDRYLALLVGGGEGRNVVEWVCGGRVVRESFDAERHGLVGTSLSVYDAAARCCVQTWMDSTGTWFHLTGARNGEGMQLRTTTLDADDYRKRMRFTRVHDEGFEWDRSRSKPGRPWEPISAISYRRVG